jgi:DMSO/TMAO reductase YedYZ heme-binding membrane subunit
MFAKNCLVVILINLVIFGIIELLSLPSLDVMTAARIFTHVGFIVNVILLILALTSKGKSA